MKLYGSILIVWTFRVLSQLDYMHMYMCPEDTSIFGSICQPKLTL